MPMGILESSLARTHARLFKAAEWGRSPRTWKEVQRQSRARMSRAEGATFGPGSKNCDIESHLVAQRVEIWLEDAEEGGRVRSGSET